MFDNTFWSGDSVPPSCRLCGSHSCTPCGNGRPAPPPPYVWRTPSHLVLIEDKATSPENLEDPSPALPAPWHRGMGTRTQPSSVTLLWWNRKPMARRGREMEARGLRGRDGGGVGVHLCGGTCRRAAVRQSKLGSQGFPGQTSRDLLFGMILASASLSAAHSQNLVSRAHGHLTQCPLNNYFFFLNQPELTSFATCVYKSSQTHQCLLK